MRFLVLLLPFIVTNLAQAEVTTAGSACHAITPAQATRMEWREQGLTNTDNATDWFVVCPFTREVGKSESRFSLSAINYGSTSTAMTCRFREWVDGSVLQRERVDTTVPGGDAGSLSWTMTPVDSNSTVNVACQLPADLRIEALSSGFSGACSNADLEGVWQTTTNDLDSVEIALFEFTDNGAVDIALISSTEGEAEGSGTFVTDRDLCAVEVEYSAGSGFARVDGSIFGLLSADKQTLQGVFANSLGSANNVVFTRLRGNFDTQALSAQAIPSEQKPGSNSLSDLANSLARALGR